MNIKRNFQPVRFRNQEGGGMPARRSMGGAADPFSNSGNINIFDQQAQRQNERLRNTPPPEATDYVPSQAVPNRRVPGNDGGEDPAGQMRNRTSTQDSSPLANYMPDDYTGQRGRQSGEPSGGNPESEPAQKPKSIFDAELKDFEDITASKQFLQEADMELVDRAMKGDRAAFVSMMNKVAQRATSEAALMSTRVTKHGLKGEFDSYSAELPKHLQAREFENLFSGPQTGVLANPKVAHLVPDVRDKFRKQYPDASPAQIKVAVTRYLEDLTGYKQEESEQSGSNRSRQQNSWSDFFS